MINLPEQFIVIGALGVVLLICLYVLIQAVMKAQAEKESRREEQYDSIFKSEKASYLMLKKYFEEIEDKLEVIEKLSKLPTEEIPEHRRESARLSSTAPARMRKQSSIPTSLCWMR